MDQFTHVFHETGNGFPGVGDEVLIEGDCGWHKVHTVTAKSSIHTRQWQANWIYLTLSDDSRDYDDTDWDDLYHVAEIEDDE